ncbi:hypothetical protein FF098_007215 [Parvularcula flava]|uniref:Uncharacterized protein n=1 Tax=Aquisalinus luteolus TaxID=1566827 RepID=A0A8J3A3I2_9PROT|nr:hypothetical protein [Aquisalinus luteolus]NHK27686.1 hypothetical protein [Aquisalinus luteolus]GGH96191.1 hypothetical protein GCM10011355_14510 [Aquisalinus luteolus]
MGDNFKPHDSVHCQYEIDGQRLDTSLSLEQSILKVKLIFRPSDQDEYFAVAGDYFAAFQSIRIDTAPLGIKFLCQGARKNVYPTGMARDMGLGLSAYQLELGKKADKSKLVRIFDAAPSSEIDTVENQDDFWRQWLASLGLEF